MPPSPRVDGASLQVYTAVFVNKGKTDKQFIVRTNTISVRPSAATSWRTSRSFCFRRATACATRRCRAGAPWVVLDGGEMATVLRLAAAGLGVALVPCLALDGCEGVAGVPLSDI